VHLVDCGAAANSKLETLSLYYTETAILEDPLLEWSPTQVHRLEDALEPTVRTNRHEKRTREGL
jgi:hypothetical protein